MRVSDHLVSQCVEIGLRFFQALKAQPFSTVYLGVPDAALDFPSGPDRDATRQRTIVREHVAIQWIQSRIVDIRL